MRWFLCLLHLLVRHVSGSAVLIFVASALGIIPLAASLGKATEDLSSKLGEKLGGLLNATMGNATELIIAFFALREGHQAVVKASLSGSIIGNVLLVLGTSVWVGGIGREKQTFDRRTVSASVTMLFIAVIALVMPAVYALSVHGHPGDQKAQALDRFSLWTGGRADCLVRLRTPVPDQEPGVPLASEGCGRAAGAIVAAAISLSFLRQR